MVDDVRAIPTETPIDHYHENTCLDIALRMSSMGVILTKQSTYDAEAHDAACMSS